MAAIHRDTISVVAIEFRDRIRHVAVDGPAATLRDLVVDWNGALGADSSASVAYVALRTALSKLVALKSGVGAVAVMTYTKLPSGIFGGIQMRRPGPQLL